MNSAISMYKRAFDPIRQYMRTKRTNKRSDQSEHELEARSDIYPMIVKKRDAVTPEESLENLENEINSWLLGYEPMTARSDWSKGIDAFKKRSSLDERKKRIYSRVLDIPDRNFLTL